MIPLRWPALLLVFLAALPAAGFDSVRQPPLGKPAPDFHLTTYDGTKLSLADFKGQVLVVNIWATWCGPCKTELPLLDAFYRFQSKAGLRVLAVTTEDSVPASRLKELSTHLAIPMVLKFKGEYGPLRAVPTNFIIDRAGIMRYAKAGALTLDAMNDILIPLLREAPRSPAPASVANLMRAAEQHLP